MFLESPGVEGMRQKVQKYDKKKIVSYLQLLGDAGTSLFHQCKLQNTRNFAQNKLEKFLVTPLTVPQLLF